MQTQSKMEWIKHGDDNIRLFFAKTKQRKLASYIYTINYKTRVLVEGFDLVRQMMCKFYKQLLGKQPSPRESISLEVIQQGAIISQEQQIHMCKEIKKAIFSIPDIKSPSPDGFYSGFYRDTWFKMGPLIRSTVKEFFSTGVIPSYISATKLVILPKVPNPQSAVEFRLISHCDVIYKSISKLLC